MNQTVYQVTALSKNILTFSVFAEGLDFWSKDSAEEPFKVFLRVAANFSRIKVENPAKKNLKYFFIDKILCRCYDQWPVAEIDVAVMLGLKKCGKIRYYVFFAIKNCSNISN